MISQWAQLFVQSLRAPADAAEQVLSINAGTKEAYLGLIAGSALNAAITGGIITIFPLPEAWPSFLTVPALYFLVVAGGLLLFVHLLTWAGRIVGGQGNLEAILKLMVWLQFVRIGLQVIGLVIMIAIPPLGSIFYMLAMGLSFWMVLNFIKVGHGLATLGGAGLALFITFVGLIAGLTLLLTLTGLGQLGVLPDV